MILVDTSVWIDHLHRGDPHLVECLDNGLVLSHPGVIEELALGSMKNRGSVLGLLGSLRFAPQLTHGEVLTLVDNHRLRGRGLSAIDVHLLGSALVVGASLWTRDKRLTTAATDLGVAPPNPPA
ncbi:MULTISPECIES: type II toxin-antitoxin system VapC family toxin [unclassified Corynebacterium]|uniref:type II toxin-antitoxin system VapC family toxin n=1 Tax=unclassified Corynebacterium TaxID=2624378 RepID=UPI00403367F2